MQEIRSRDYDITGERECQCPTCYRVFTGIDGFDSHRVKGQCVEPSTRGYKLDWKGRWTKGMGSKRTLPQDRSGAHRQPDYCSEVSGDGA